MRPCSGETEASLLVGSDLRELARVSAWVQDWAERQRLAPRVAQQLDLCSGEVVTNIVSYALDAQDARDARQHIQLRLGWQGEDVALDVEDEGRPFDPSQAPEPLAPTRLEDARLGGWGIPILRRFSDGMRYRREGGRNCLTLLFHAVAPP